MSAFGGKLLDLDALVRVREGLRAAGKTVVQCHGYFDIVHPGHIRYLRFARQQGDALIVSALGILSRIFLARWIAERIGALFHRLPGVQLIYDAVKDVIEALLGEKKMFDRPVLVTLEAPINGELLGFVTCDDLAWIGLEGTVSVYLPQSFGWAGQMILMPADRVRPLAADASQVTQFLVSGGISRGGADVGASEAS